jgi:hypothetical protein
MDSQSSVSIWFFIGIALLVNGALVLGAGVYQLLYPPENPVVLFHLHSSIWWGTLLFLLGAFYCYRFAPGKRTK